MTFAGSAAGAVTAASATIAGAVAAQAPTLGDYVERVAATISALAVIGAGAWWLLGPRVREYLDTQRRAAQASVEQLAPTDGRPGLGRQVEQLRELFVDQLADAAEDRAVLRRHSEQLAELGELPAKVADLDSTVAQFMAEAAAEARMMRAARLLAAMPPAPPQTVEIHTGNTEKESK